MGKSNAEVSVPGAAATTPAETATDPLAQGATPQDPRDAEIAALRAQLSTEQAKNAPQGSALVFEGDGPNTRKYKAESKHMDYTAAELDKLVRAGKVKLTDHHVLCKDGWYVNPAANAVHNG